MADNDVELIQENDPEFDDNEENNSAEPGENVEPSGNEEAGYNEGTGGSDETGAGEEPGESGESGDPGSGESGNDESGTDEQPHGIERNVGAVTAYGIAKKHGFVGTEEEWLESLAAESLPDVDIEDDGKVIQCVNGVWVAQKAELDNDTIAPLTNAEILAITAQ